MMPVNVSIDQLAETLGKPKNSGVPYYTLIDSQGKVYGSYE